MTPVIMRGLLIPFAGTSLGAACVLFVKNKINNTLCSALNGFAAGVMTAASVWSLLLPSIERSKKMGVLAFIPAAVGFTAGIAFLLLTDKFLPQFEKLCGKNTHNSSFRRTALLVFAVVLHNIPEGMAVGAAFSGVLDGSVSRAAAFVLSLGIAIQNFPEGAIISMPLASGGMKKSKALFYGILSGAVEPFAGMLTVILSGIAIPVLPYLLSFAAGAMMLVVVKELVPDMNETGTNTGVYSFTAGFLVMMSLDVAFG